MLFEGRTVYGACWVEIVRITNKDGSELSADNWRRERFGRVSLCWIAGGLKERNAFFKGDIRLESDGPVVISLNAISWCSTTTAYPVEVEPGIFDFETNTSIYRFRILSDEESKLVDEAVEAALYMEL